MDVDTAPSLGPRPATATRGSPVPATVLDPFLGAARCWSPTVWPATAWVELNPEYADMARRRIASDAPLLSGEAYEPRPRRRPLEVPSPLSHQDFDGWWKGPIEAPDGDDLGPLFEEQPA